MFPDVSDLYAQYVADHDDPTDEVDPVDEVDITITCLGCGCEFVLHATDDDTIQYASLDPFGLCPKCEAKYNTVLP